MQIRRWLAVVSLLVFPITLAAQKTDDPAKERTERRSALIEQASADLQNLRLAENRAGLGVRIGSLLWRSDPERARAMFVSASEELANAQVQAEAASKKTNVQNELLYGGSLRGQILNSIAGHDAELALELMVKTRPTTVTRAINAPADSKKVNTSGTYVHLAQNEVAMEQRFLKMAASQNPERMIKLLKAGLAKGLTHETLEMLRKLHEKDPSEAKTIGIQVLDKLIGSKYSFTETAGSQAAQFGISFVNDAIQRRDRNDKAFRFEESQLKALAEKLVAFYLGAQPGYLNHSIIAIAEKYAPSNVEKFKELSKNNRFRGDFYMDPEIQGLMKPETPAIEVISAAKKAPAQSRHALFENAISKLTQNGDIDGAASVISNNYEGEALENAMNNLRSQQGYRLMNEEKFAEAERIFDEQPENSRIHQLLNLAAAVYGKDPVENKAYALSVIEKVRAMVPDRPENASEMSNLMQVINAYANIESDEAVRMFEQIVPQVNNLADAAAVLNPFHGNNNVRQGEFIVSSGFPYNNFGFDLNVLSRMAVKDHEKTIRMVDLFTRPETRILIRLQLAESLN